jgi:hypothetical protein
MIRLFFLLMVVMSYQVKEIDMARLMDEDVRNPAKPLVPAWAGKGAREGKSPVLKTAGGFGGMRTGSGNKSKPTFTDALVSSAAAANTNGGGQWLSMDGQPAPQPAYLNPERPKAPAWMRPVVDAIAAANTNGGGQWLSMDGKPAPQPAYVKPTIPAWMNPRPPAYGGSYNPTVAPTPDTPSPEDTYDSYQGEPVNNSYSDLLRSLEPVALGSGEVSMSDYLRSLEAGSPYVLPPSWMDPNGQQSGYYSGFGSQYGGNWRRGGGEYGGYDAPAWMSNEMGLFSWKM